MAIVQLTGSAAAPGEDPRGSVRERLAAMQKAAELPDWDRVMQLLHGVCGNVVSEAPAELLRIVEGIPRDLLEQHPQWEAARGYLRYWTGADPSTRFRQSAAIPPGASLLATLVHDAGRAAELRMAGSFDLALAVVRDSQEGYENAKPADREACRAAYPDLAVQWARSREFAGDLIGALRLYREAYDEAVHAGNDRIRDAAAGGIAWAQALDGDTQGASAWLDRLSTPEGVGAPTTARLARALRHLDRWQVDEAQALLRDVRSDGRSEYWAATALLAARAARTRGAAVQRLSELSTTVKARTEPVRSGTNRGLWTAARIELYLRLDCPDDARAAVLGNTDGGGPVLRLLEVRAALPVEEPAILRPRAARVAREVVDSPRLFAAAHLMLAALAARADDADDAAVHFADAMAIVAAQRLYTSVELLTRDEFDTLSAATGIRVAEIDRAIAAGVVAFDSARRTVLSRLTAAERPILTLLAEGRTNAEIAQELYLSPNTVKTHLRRMFARLGVRSRADAAALLRAGGDGARG